MENTRKIQVISQQIVRVYEKEGQKESFAIETPLQADTTYKEKTVGDKRAVETQFLQVLMDGKGNLEFMDKEGNLLCKDYTGETYQVETLSQEELELMRREGHAVEEKEKCKFKVYQCLFGDESIYGLGDKTGFLNKLGYEYMMWNSDNPDPHVENGTFKALYKSIPFFIVQRKDCVYGIFMDNTYRSYFDMGYESRKYYSFGAVKGDLDYYFIGGENMAQILENYTALTGRAPLPQMWTLGYHQSRWSYLSAKEVLSVAKQFRQYGIPCDGIHLDIDYMDNFKVFTVNKERFPDMQELSDELGEMGIKLVTIIDPGTKVEKGYAMYDQGMEKGYFAKDSEGKVYENVVWPGDSVYPDYTSHKVRQWWGDQTEKLTQQGIRGIWNDMNEPASFRGPLPDDVVFPGDGKERLHEEVHNVYGHLMAKATYEGLKKKDGKRPFVITRACYSGTQKYATAWTGDNQSLWAHLQMSIPQLLNLGMSGMPFVGTDIGGFGADTTPELLSRWVEASCFAPLFRNHSAKYVRRQEPWRFDQDTLEINRKYITLRYRYLPYLYDLCYEESKTGVPMLRPLVMEYPKEAETRECNDEYLVGKSLLVAPVVEQGARARMIYLPEGEWIDYWTGEHMQGRKYILKEAPLDICPMYVKAGSILPAFEKMESIEPDQIHKLILEYYPFEKEEKQNASYVHYEDNGTDFAYEAGEYNLYEFTVENTGKVQTSMIHEGYENGYREITVQVMK